MAPIIAPDEPEEATLDRMVFRIMNDIAVSTRTLHTMLFRSPPTMETHFRISDLICEIIVYGGSKERIMRLLQVAGFRIEENDYDREIEIIRSFEVSFHARLYLQLERHDGPFEATAHALNSILASQVLDPLLTHDNLRAMLDRLSESRTVFYMNLENPIW